MTDQRCGTDHCYDRMSSREITRQVAERILGWSDLTWREEGSKEHPEGGILLWSKGWYGKNPLGNPGFIGSRQFDQLNNCVLLEEKIQDKAAYVHALVRMILNEKIQKYLLKDHEVFALVTATARQRCVAMLISMDGVQQEG